MPINLPLSEMTLHEKLAIMESLWEDLIRTPESVESPAWHDEVLKERSQQIAEGHSRFSDWEKAKANIRNKLS
jgi:hypothetical protein